MFPLTIADFSSISSSLSSVCWENILQRPNPFKLLQSHHNDYFHITGRCVDLTFTVWAALLTPLEKICIHNHVTKKAIK
jgi:hypothetical protein